MRVSELTVTAESILHGVTNVCNGRRSGSDGLVVTQLHQHREPLAKLGLEVLGGPHAAEGPVHHDGYPLAECLTLLHAGIGLTNISSTSIKEQKDVHEARCIQNPPQDNFLQHFESWQWIKLGCAKPTKGIWYTPMED